MIFIVILFTERNSVRIHSIFQPEVEKMYHIKDHLGQDIKKSFVFVNDMHSQFFKQYLTNKNYLFSSPVQLMIQLWKSSVEEMIDIIISRIFACVFPMNQFCWQKVHLNIHLNFTRMSNFTVIGKLIEQKYHLESKKITNYEFWFIMHIFVSWFSSFLYDATWRSWLWHNLCVKLCKFW